MKNFRKSIYNVKDNINVHFYHSYVSCEKSGVENFNGLIRKIYQKGFDFSTMSQNEIDNQIKKINEIYREPLMFKSAKEIYSELCQIDFGTLNYTSTVSTRNKSNHLQNLLLFNRQNKKYNL